MRAMQLASATDPAWMAPFLDSLARADLAPATRRGYRYDLHHFLAWRARVQPDAFAIERLTEHDLIGVTLKNGRESTPCGTDRERRPVTWPHRGPGSA